MLEVTTRSYIFDKLVHLPVADIIRRREVITAEVEQVSTYLDELRKNLKKYDEIFHFLQRERENTVLAEEVIRGNKVRVICPTCQGTGQRQVDVTGGRLQVGSAFETIGSQPSAVTSKVIEDPRLRCPKCEGKRWLLMDKFVG